MYASPSLRSGGWKAAWAVVAVVMAIALSVAGPIPARADTSQPPAREPVTTWGTPYCTDSGAAVDVSLTIDPHVYPECTYVSFLAEHENSSSQDTDLTNTYAYTDQNGSVKVSVPMPRTLYGTDLPTGVTWIDISWSAGKDEYGNDIWVEGESNGYSFPAECRSPVPPPAEVCVLKTGNGSATVDYRGIRRTLYFASSVKLPVGCVTAAEAKAFADKHGIRWPA